MRIAKIILLPFLTLPSLPSTTAEIFSTSFKNPSSNAAISPSTNPFQSVRWFPDPIYQSQVQSSLSLLSASQSPLLPAAKVAQTAATPLWVASEEAAQKNLTEHLRAARKWGRNGGGGGVENGPVLVQLIVYNLPDRDCSAAASEGDLKISDGGEERYRKFIEGIAETLWRYPDLRVVVTLEPDAIPNMVTNAGDPNSKCGKAKPVQLNLIAYAIKTLTLPNLRVYLDFGHSGWLGWSGNQDSALNLLESLATLLPTSPIPPAFYN
ncbi:hypothetical protein HK097_008817 [Rhizophlyctis rosea]|uniref:Glucanase n=1 Tax=Rhizophlyctis rosea TaxID=64517 RepID=A0AAD5SHW0_9FUNG|nr:hypothetical protein HK097_008817 [Rhizophlyctis rosea]